MLSALTGWALFAALTGALGVLTGRGFLVSHSADPSRPDQLARMGRVPAALLVLALMAVFYRQFLEFRDPFAPRTEEAVLLLGTAWGSTWTRAVVAAAVALLGFSVASRFQRMGWGLAAIGTLAVAAFPARTGHANAIEDLRVLALIGDTAHVLAAGMWVGGLVVLLILVRRERGVPRLSNGIPTMVHAFSGVARAAVATLVVTGVWAVWLHIPDPRAWATTPYGRILLMKIALVAVALALGWWNWKRVTPRLTEEGGARLLTRVGGVELVVAQLILLVTAVLVRTSP